MRLRSLLTASVLSASTLLAGCGERYRAEERFSAIRKRLTASAGELTRLPAKDELSASPSIKGKVAVFQREEMKAGPVNGGAYWLDIYYFNELGEAYAAT